jgi:hypothetical protein
MFARNGRSGYVLKPANLRVKNKEAQNTAESRTLHVKVLTGFPPVVPLLRTTES